MTCTAIYVSSHELTCTCTPLPDVESCDMTCSRSCMTVAFSSCRSSSASSRRRGVPATAPSSKAVCQYLYCCTSKASSKASKVKQQRRPRAAAVCQYLYCCISKASKVITSRPAAAILRPIAAEIHLWCTYSFLTRISVTSSIRQHTSAYVSIRLVVHVLVYAGLR
jgi:hypothetical protein